MPPRRIWVVGRPPTFLNLTAVPPARRFVTLVEEILEERKKRKTKEYLVKWLGY